MKCTRSFSINSTKHSRFRGFTLVEWLVVVGIIGVLLALLMPTMRSGRAAARRTQCIYNLKHIGLALHYYQETYGSFPPAYTVDALGKKLHSWRTLILPFMDQQALYDTIDLTKPWDDPVNAAAFETRLNAFQCPSARIAPNHTCYLGLAGAGLFFDGPQTRTLRDLTDGPSTTLAVVDVSAEQAVPWMSPQDADEQLILNINKQTDVSHVGGFQALYADGSQRDISVTTETALRRALMTIAGDDHDAIGEY